MGRLAVILLVLAFGVLSGAAAPAGGGLEELRTRFTVQGRPVPPEVFSDFGDADLADSTDSIRVTIDVNAAIGSNLYADEITTAGNWVAQTRTLDQASGLKEEISYKFIGTTQNRLLVVLAAYSGGGSGTFYTLHLLDAASAPAFDGDGKPYHRLDVTVVRNIALGDRWDGSVTISGNQIRVATVRQGPGDATGRPPTTRTIEAKRP